MISNYVRTALRALRKRPGYAFLNGFGLSLGLACFLLVGMFVADELRYDRHHEGADRIVRIGLSGYPPSGGGDHFAMVSPPVGQVIRDEFPEVEAVVRFRTATPSVKVGDQTFSPENVWVTEPQLLDVFTMPVVHGSSEGLLEEPGTTVLTESAAEQFFGSEQAVGQHIIIDDTLEVTVAAVIEDQPRTSHMHPGMLLSWSTYAQFVPTGWLNVGFYTYARLRPGESIDAFGGKVRTLVNERNAQEMDAIGFRAELVAEPLTDIYLHSKRSAQIGPVGDMTQVWIFGAVAVFVLLLAVINFTNLATARSMERAREVGIRKVVGSTRPALILQFLAESTVMSLIASVFATLVMAAGLPIMNTVAGKEIAIVELLSPGNIAILVSVALVAGALGGLYPSVVMSRFKSVSVLKGAFHSGRHGAVLRKGLVAFQFAISIALLAGTAIVMRQLEYMQSQDLGFNEDRMLIINAQNVSGGQFAARSETIKTEFEKVAGVTDVSLSSSVPGRAMGRILFGAEGVDEDDVRSANVFGVGYDYFDNYGIDIVEGRVFSEEFTADENESVIVTESMVEYLGWDSAPEAIGKWVSFGGPNRRDVVGVVRDYHHTSLKEAVEPIILVLNVGSTGYISLRMAPGNMLETREAVSSTWAKLFPSEPLDSFFLDGDYDRQYETERRLRRLFSIFALLAVAIACLGLIGLAAFTAQQRTKEIGVRKVLGASVPGIVALLSKEFLVLVATGFVIAVPIAAYGMDKWMETFPYRAGLGALPFVLAGVGALVIALLSVSYQAVRAALADPVESLRYE